MAYDHFEGEFRGSNISIICLNPNYASTLSDSDRDRDKFYVELQLYRYGASLPKSDMTIAGSNEIAVMNR